MLLNKWCLYEIKLKEFTANDLKIIMYLKIDDLNGAAEDTDDDMDKQFLEVQKRVSSHLLKETPCPTIKSDCVYYSKS